MLDLQIKVVDRETGNFTESFTQLSLTQKELGFVNMLMETLQFGGELIRMELDN
jgi:hypothetical protein